MVDKIMSWFTTWEARSLSMAGHTCLVKSFISSYAIHSMSVINGHTC